MRRWAYILGRSRNYKTVEFEIRHLRRPTTRDLLKLPTCLAGPRGMVRSPRVRDGKTAGAGRRRGSWGIDGLNVPGFIPFFFGLQVFFFFFDYLAHLVLGCSTHSCPVRSARKFILGR